MSIKSIRTEKDYQEALERLEVIFDATKETPKGDELEILGILIDQYENENFPIDLADPTS
jgi:HTH-type transcriptional regulator / antitoxin HigA